MKTTDTLAGFLLSLPWPHPRSPTIDLLKAIAWAGAPLRFFHDRDGDLSVDLCGGQGVRRLGEKLSPIERAAAEAEILNRPRREYVSPVEHPRLVPIAGDSRHMTLEDWHFEADRVLREIAGPVQVATPGRINRPTLWTPPGPDRIVGVDFAREEPAVAHFPPEHDGNP